MSPTIIRPYYPDITSPFGQVYVQHNLDGASYMGCFPWDQNKSKSWIFQNDGIEVAYSFGRCLGWAKKKGYKYVSYANEENEWGSLKTQCYGAKEAPKVS